MKIPESELTVRRRLLLLAAISLLAGGTVAFHFIEGWSFIDSLYFCTATMATVGFGDIAPKTDIGKLVTVAYILMGVGIFASFFTIQMRYRAVKIAHRRRQRGSEDPVTRALDGSDPR